MATVILGIDPGSRCTGYGIIENNNNQCKHIFSGNIRPDKQSTISDRLHCIYQHILTLIKQHNPHHLAIEKVFVGNNASAALKLGQARSCALIAAAKTSVPIFEYSPREVKQAITGYGAASKMQIQQMVTHLLRLSKQPAQDAADALAIALCHANIYAFHQKIREK